MGDCIEARSRAQHPLQGAIPEARPELEIALGTRPACGRRASLLLRQAGGTRPFWGAPHQRPKPSYVNAHRASCPHISVLPAGYTTWTAGDYLKVVANSIAE